MAGKSTKFVACLKLRLECGQFSFELSTRWIWLETHFASLGWMILKNKNRKIKNILYVTLLTSALIFPISPTALASVIEAKSSDCVTFYENHIEKAFVLPLLKKVKFFNLTSAHGSLLTVIDLAQVQPMSSLDRMVKSYFQYVRDIYRARLKKFDTQISPAALSQQAHIDKELTNRSILIVDTPSEQATAESEFNGGVRVTLARNPNEKLPLQFELPDYRRHDISGTSIEVGRLTAQPGVSAGLSINLIRVAVQLALQYPNVRDIYVHTSRVHSRLYKLMGLIPASIDI